MFSFNKYFSKYFHKCNKVSLFIWVSLRVLSLSQGITSKTHGNMADTRNVQSDEYAYFTREAM